MHDAAEDSLLARAGVPPESISTVPQAERCRRAVAQAQADALAISAVTTWHRTRATREVQAPGTEQSGISGAQRWFEVRVAAIEPPDSQLFQPLTRLHAARAFSGDGIGLATVRRIVMPHGARIWAQGPVDAGATICFTLPPSPREREYTSSRPAPLWPDIET